MDWRKRRLDGLSPDFVMGVGEFDHVAWVTMTTEDPRVANLLLEGILPDDLRSVSTEEVLAQIQASRPVRFENQVNIAPLLSDEAHEEELRVQFHNFGCR